MDAPATHQLSQCPDWCAQDPVAHPLFAHASESSVVGLRLGADATQYLEIRVVQCVPAHDEPETATVAEPGWSPFIEVAHHSEGRYRVLNLSPDAARAAARLLWESADRLEAGGGSTTAPDQP